MIFCICRAAIIVNAFRLKLGREQYMGAWKYQILNLVLIQAPMYFSVYYINYRFSTNIKCTEAMIGNCLKSDNFHM